MVLDSHHLSVFELLDLRRVPYGQTISEIRKSLPPVDNGSARSQLVLSGLEPLILSMTNPLEINISSLSDGSVPEIITGKVDVHETADENLATAKAEFTKFLGHGFDPNAESLRIRAEKEWWWGRGELQLHATLPAEPSKSVAGRLAAMFTHTSHLPTACIVRIETSDPRQKLQEHTSRTKDLGAQKSQDYASRTKDMVAHGRSIAASYYELVDRIDGANPPSEEELVQLFRALTMSSMDMGSSKGLDTSKISHDQELRRRHVISMLPAERRPSNPRNHATPHAGELKEAQNRFWADVRRELACPG